MSRHLAITLTVAGLLCCGAAFAQVQRTFVASTGSDANTATNCGFAAPCRSFTAAQTMTQSGGEIIALDAAGYGAITITKSISILANPGVYAGISASSGNAVTIATAGVNVRLSGLKINGIGASNGIRMTDGASLVVDNCTVSGFGNNGIWVSGAIVARVVDVLVMNSAQDGIVFDSGAVGYVANAKALGNARVGIFSEALSAISTTVAVSNSAANGGLAGFASRAETGGTAAMSVSGSSADFGAIGFYVFNANGGVSSTFSLSSSRATGNGTGIENTGGTFNSAGNNMVTGNSSNAAGAITNIGTM